MANKKSWSELSDTQKALVVAGGAFEVVLTTLCMRDLARRPAGEVRGPRAAWFAALVVQPVGPMAYLAWGRKR